MTDNFRRPGPNRNSIDGFVSSNQGRNVGFNSAPPRRASLDGNARVRMRRPGLHHAPGNGADRAARPNSNDNSPSTARTGMRQHSNADLTTYKATRTTGGNTANDAHFGDLGSFSNAGKNVGNTGRRPRSRFGRGTKKASFWRRTNWKKVAKRTSLAMLVLIVATGGWLGYRLIRTTTKVFGDNSSVLGFLNSTKLNGEDKGRVNMLLAGVSTDDPGHDGADLTDSIMLASIDTVNHKAFLMSIPRDLWVNIPGYGHSKINAANAYGDTSKFSEPGLPDGGMGLLEKVVSSNLQIPIHYYAKVNYSAFKDAVNAVGGITVTIKSDDPRGLYDPNINKQDNGPLKLPNGPQKLDGQTALNLARARGDPTGDGRVAYGFARSDFTRTENQRLMLLALKEKVTSGGVITNPLKISELFDTVGKNMKTDLKPSEIRRLYDINKQTSSGSVDSLSLNDAGGVNLLASYRSPDGASALAPAAGVDDFSQIQLFLKKAMTNDPVIKESAKVVILNGGDTSGLATKFSNYATSKGLNVVAVDDAPHTVGPNIIIDQTTKKAPDGSSSSGKPGTKARLKQIFGSDSGSSATANVGYPTADFVVILGTNQKAPATASSQGD